ncbi:MAG: protein tyrosine phosphatase family protein [Gammaproteobacteria bacterium]|nr:protein tyrosine phosphatase family protein [Gammaproteobacteria bacterium]
MNIQFNFLVVAGLLLISLLAACSNSSDLDIEAMRNAGITNLRNPEGYQMSSGQPTASQLETAAAAGLKYVINLRTPQEDVDFDEAEVVESLGMEYFSIPVATGGSGVTTENAASLQELLGRFNGEPVLVHCASGNRVGALMALSAFSGGATIDKAMENGARWGMTSEGMQQRVRASLSTQ